MIQLTRLDRAWVAGLASEFVAAVLIAPPVLLAAETDGETEDQLEVEGGVQAVILEELFRKSFVLCCRPDHRP